MAEFFKFQGAGNDFILFDNRNITFDGTDNKLIEKLCNRKFGIGADGLMLLQNTNGYDFEMKFYNCDGFSANMCGNGARCIVAFAKKLGIIEGKALFIAPDGEHEAILNNNLVSVKLTDANGITKFGNDYFLNTGVPHFVKFVEDIDSVDVYTEGKALRFDKQFGKDGANVNFVQIQDKHIKIRTYERGVENETLACGTGIAAAAIAVAEKRGLANTKIKVKARGGVLSVSLELVSSDNAVNVWLEGPAEFVFSGNIEF
jgi:diaminopimelate epimerase